MTGMSTWITVKVAAKRREARDITSFALVHPDGAPLTGFAAGAHLDVEIAPGLVRQYSLCNDPRERDRYLIAVLRETASRGGSVRLVDEVEVGATLRVSEPRNHFALDARADRVLLFAGGIGITPLLSMAERLAHVGIPFVLHYCSRSRERLAFAERLAVFGTKVVLHLDDEGSRLDMGAVLRERGPNDHLYVCGPKPFIEAALETGRVAGWPADSLHREFFSGAEETDRDGDAPFEVELSSSGQRFAVPAGTKVIDVLAANGVSIPTSCEQGVCGTCVTRVLRGTPDHRDLFLTDQERAKNDQFTPCCSRSKTSLLVLDL